MADPKLDLQMKDAKALAEGYSKGARFVEVASIVTFWVLVLGTVYTSWPYTSKMPWLTLAAFVVGILLADFTSGFVHWLADTWGSIDMPVIGKALLRPFREHHVDQKAITRHDYIETNGMNCMISVPWALGAFLVPLRDGEWLATLLFVVVAITSMIFWVMMTNQFHKWSHLDEHEAPALVRWLQKAHFILPPAHHAVHHTAPFNKYYCITNGWLNWPLTKLAFFPTLERLVTATTGAIPRKDDIGLKAALAIAPVAQPSAEAQVDLPRP